MVHKSLARYLLSMIGDLMNNGLAFKVVFVSVPGYASRGPTEQEFLDALFA